MPDYLPFIRGGHAAIEALIEIVGPDGMIMMPTQSWKNLDPEEGVHWDAAEMFRTWLGSIRSDHPARSVCAWGRHAAYLAENHDLSNIFGEDSPIAKLYELNGKVLLLGIGKENTIACGKMD